MPADLPVINALWIGQLSPVERLCLGSFASQGHPVHLYAYEEIENLPAGITLQDAAQILPRSLIFKNQLGKGKGSLAAFSDLFRFKLMLDRGGWWVDADIFCLKPFDFTTPYVFGFEGAGVASGVIKMPRGCGLAERCFDLARRVDPATIVWIELVKILDAAIRDLRLLDYVLPQHTFSPIDWREIPKFVTGRKTFAIPENSHAVHLYNEMWRRHHLDKHRRYPANSILNILRRHAGIETLDTELPPSILSLTTRRIAQTIFRRAA
ncbi:MAG TPA: capsular polysaccharide synthesis protein [Pirellulaceae bacterium]|jgi:hypothetical protein